VPRHLAAAAALVMLMSITTPADAATRSDHQAAPPSPVVDQWAAQARSSALAAYRHARHDAGRLGRRVGRPHLGRVGGDVRAIDRARSRWERRDRRFQNLLVRRDKVLHAVARQVGTPYRWGGASPSGFDCSGLVMWSYARAGRSLPHSTYALLRTGRAVRRGGIRPGDLVFSEGGGHVGIYVGGGVVIHAPHAGARVTRVPLRYWPLTAIRRII
jgi:cell wall-associated NlpC family hydrolase